MENFQEIKDLNAQGAKATIALHAKVDGIIERGHAYLLRVATNTAMGDGSTLADEISDMLANESLLVGPHRASLNQLALAMISSSKCYNSFARLVTTLNPVIVQKSYQQ